MLALPPLRTPMLRPTLALAAVLLVPAAHAQTAPPTRRAFDGARAALVHTGRDGLGAGVMLPLGRSGAVRATVFAARDGREAAAFGTCVFHSCSRLMYVRDQRVGAAAALLVRGDAWGGARLYVGVDAALRRETQRQTTLPTCSATMTCVGRDVSLSRWTVRPGLVGGAEVALGARLGAFVEASAAVLQVPDGRSEWRETTLTPLRAGAGVRVAW